MTKNNRFSGNDFKRSQMRRKTIAAKMSSISMTFLSTELAHIIIGYMRFLKIYHTPHWMLVNF